MKTRVVVRVPATSGNLGPGFDCLGMALDMWNSVRLEIGRDFQVSIRGVGAGELSQGRDNLVYRAAESVFRQAGINIPNFRLECHNNIPLSRGLGSSAAAVVGGVVAANALLDEPLSQYEVLDLVSRLEGHPDNVTPALLGGCQIVTNSDEGLSTFAVPIPRGLFAVLFIPDQPMPTQEGRALLSPEVTREDAVFNLGRTALLVAAFSTGKIEYLRTATEDRLHQPARQQIFPAMKYIFRAALGAGALGVFLSGGGSTVLALTRDRHLTIGYEMADAAVKMGAPGLIEVVRPSRRGATISRLED